MISLITATLGRTEPIIQLLDSLVKQTYQNFELIIVDQNLHDKIGQILSCYTDKIKIIHIKNRQKGLSLNRNVGLQYACGEIIGFPDDDCYYSEDVLEKVIETFDQHQDISFCATDWRDSIIIGNPARCFDETPITKRLTYKMCISFNVFIRNNWNIRFDERLGVGAAFGAGEETDYLYSLIKVSNKNGWFFNSKGIYHPVETSREISKTHNYAIGQGAVWKKDLMERHNISVLYDILKTSLRYAISALKPRNIPVVKATLSGFYTGLTKYHAEQ